MLRFKTLKRRCFSGHTKGYEHKWSEKCPNSNHNGQKATVHWTKEKTKTMFNWVYGIVYGIVVVDSCIDNINWCSDFVHRTYLFQIPYPQGLKPLAWQLRLHGPQALINQHHQTS